MTPAGTSNELDVQNEWEENTHTHCRRFSDLKKRLKINYFVDPEEASSPKTFSFSLFSRGICLVVHLVTAKHSDVGTFESRRSHTNMDFSSYHAQQVEIDYLVGTQNYIYLTVDEGRRCVEWGPLP